MCYVGGGKLSLIEHSKMVSAVNIAIEGESQPLCTYITKKCATHINSEAEMISKNSHMDWSAIA